jgi:hypothetical protein
LTRAAGIKCIKIVARAMITDQRQAALIDGFTIAKPLYERGISEHVFALFL